MINNEGGPVEPKKFLCVGNTWDEQLLDSLIAMNASRKNDVIVKEVFGSSPLFTPSVRTADRLPKKSVDEIAAFVKRAKENNIEPHWTMNQMLNKPLEGFKLDWHEGLRPAVHQLWDMGVKQFVVANPLLLSLIHKTLPDAYLEVSTVAGVSSVKMLEEWRLLGADGVCPSLDLNRDLDGLRALGRVCKKYGMRLKLLVNEACLQGCPHRHTTCYLSQSFGSARSKDLFDGYPFWCNSRRVEDPSQWLKAPVIIPQWLDYYDEVAGASWFKITGRTHPTSTVLGIVEKYMAKKWDGNMLDLIPQYTHLIGLDQVDVKIDTEAWNNSGPPFLRDPRFRCLDHCGVTCNFCDTTMERIGEIGSA